MTMSLIQTITVGAGGAANINFTSIPGTYTDLLILLSARTADATVTTNLMVRFNNDSAANYGVKRLYGTGSAFGSDQTTADTKINLIGAPGASATASTFGNGTIYIPNYTASIAKSVSIDAVAENNATATILNTLATNWTGTAAITQCTISPASGLNFAQYSTASIYGITKGSGGATVA